MWERLKICWYALTMHTYVVFFCNKKADNIQCYVDNSFKEFDDSIAEFIENGYE